MPLSKIICSTLICILFQSLSPATNAQRSFDQKIEEALQYCKENAMNMSYCVMVDMSVHSGKNRMFVYDFKQKKIIIKGLCAHGSGGGSTPFKPVFSNKVKSNCTSLGKYRIGSRAYSNWGIHAHYKLHGMESTNSNAYKRIVVLHSYSPVPEHEIHPYGLHGVSMGCPVIADLTMIQIDNLIKSGEKNMLLWVYN
ncbi:MAG: murein L,D-transpeptidase catalytic domain family protein [Bacteroidota bacterium]